MVNQNSTLHINTTLVIQLEDGFHRTTNWPRVVARSVVLDHIKVRATLFEGDRAPSIVPFSRRVTAVAR